MQVHEREQDEDARLIRGPDGGLMLVMKAGLMSPRARAALALVLAGVGGALMEDAE